jgi:ABC-type branched-subunit amino acid transport system ATPase component
MSLLEVRHIAKKFGSVNALTDVSLDVNDGERVALIGPNGSGKTTLFNTISGVFPPNGGTVHFEGRRVTSWSTNRLARHGLVRTFQHATVFPGLTVEESVVVALEMIRRTGNEDSFYSVSTILETCGLTAQRNALGSDLAYGSARRLNVAVAMAAHPTLLMLDEPAAGLNDWETEELRVALAELNARGIAILVIDHDMPFISGLCQRAVVLAAGSVLAQGTLDEIRADHEVRRVYLGESLAG